MSLNMKGPLWARAWHIIGPQEVFAKLKSAVIKPTEGFIPGKYLLALWGKGRTAHSAFFSEGKMPHRH